jgi:hypothetical protein
MAGLDTILKVITPKRMRAKGNIQTNTFSADRKSQVLSAPAYKEHLTDLFNSRQSDDSRKLMKQLFIHDPDVSAAVNAFLTVADTEPVFTVRDANGEFDRPGQVELNKLLAVITTRFDYSKGFQMKQSVRALSENMRYLLLLRGGIGNELVFDKTQIPNEIRHVDMSTVEWFEKEANLFIPQQRAPASNDEISLDVPTFFVSFFRRDPTSIYTYSPFVSAINTVAARQQVINDLYRIMQITGYPRIEAKVLEEVLLKNAPQGVQSDGKKQQAYIQGELTKIQSTLSNTSPDQALVHTDSVELSMFNDKSPANALNIDSIIGALNAMNQAGLRSMATILGRGESGVNTASVEARIFSMHAEALNEPIAEQWSQLMTMALRVVAKSESKVTCKFRPVELRPETELEPMLALRASRLRQDLSDGMITDDEYHLEMYSRIRPDDAPEMSGTGFMNPTSIGVDETQVSPNADPLGKGLTPKGKDAAKGSNVTKKKAKK